MSFVLDLQSAPSNTPNDETPDWRPTSTLSPITCYSTVSLALC